MVVKIYCPYTQIYAIVNLSVMDLAILTSLRVLCEFHFYVDET